MNHRFLIIIIALLAPCVTLFAQGERKDKTAVTYEELYDEPSSVNKLFVAIQPIYGELFSTNVNAGFGGEVVYYHKDKMNFRAHFRKTYSQEFFDFARDLAVKKSDVQNRSEVYNYFEVGGTYHIRDFEESSKTKMFLYKNSYKGHRWAARVPLSAEIPCKVRKIYGGRLGGILWNSSVDISRAMEKQGLTNRDLLTTEGVSLPNTVIREGRQESLDVFSNISSPGLYLGGSMTWIKNVAVNFDKFEEGIDDLIFTVYADLLVAPSTHVDDIVYTSTDATSPNFGTHTYAVSPVKTKMLGFRVGMDGRFNRMFSWAYGAEVGYRPSFEGRSFYAMFKISFPVFGTNLDYKVESFGK